MFCSQLCNVNQSITPEECPPFATLPAALLNNDNVDHLSIEKERVENAVENASDAAKFELPFFPGDGPFTGSIIDVSQRRRKRPGQRRRLLPPLPPTRQAPLSNNDILHNVVG